MGRNVGRPGAGALIRRALRARSREGYAGRGDLFSVQSQRRAGLLRPRRASAFTRGPAAFLLPIAGLSWLAAAGLLYRYLFYVRQYSYEMFSAFAGLSAPAALS